MEIQGARVWTVGDDIDTDVLIPARYVALASLSEMARHTLEPIQPEFASGVQPGDVLVAGHNFGSGSSREHAVLVLKELGISCVLARSFARIFYRNGINNGLLLLTVPTIDVPAGHHVDVDSEKGRVVHVESQESHEADVMPKIVGDIIEAGGLIPYTKRAHAKE